MTASIANSMRCISYFPRACMLRMQDSYRCRMLPVASRNTALLLRAMTSDMPNDGANSKVRSILDQPTVRWVGKYLKILTIPFKSGSWEYAERVNTKSVVAIFPVTKKREVILIEQFRAPLNKVALEIPSGLIDLDSSGVPEPAMDAASRELQEETGYKTDKLQLLAELPVSPGLTSESYTLFYAGDLDPPGKANPDVNEDILAVHTVPIYNVYRYLQQRQKEGLLIDPRIYVGLYFYGKLNAANSS